MFQQQATNNEQLPDDVLRYHLVQLGAPLALEFDRTCPPASKRVVFQGALKLVRHDPTLARCFPLLVEKNQDFFANREELLQLAQTQETTKVLGFFLDLAGELTGHPELSERANFLYDKLKREPELEPFFATKKLSKRARLVAEQTTPEIARKWGFLLNIGMDSFESLFRKFSLHRQPPPPSSEKGLHVPPGSKTNPQTFP